MKKIDTHYKYQNLFAKTQVILIFIINIQNFLVIDYCAAKHEIYISLDWIGFVKVKCIHQQIKLWKYQSSNNPNLKKKTYNLSYIQHLLTVQIQKGCLHVHLVDIHKGV